VGEVLEIWSGDANTKNDMPKWCEKVGHLFLGALPGEGYERLFIKRANNDLKSGCLSTKR